MAGSEHSSSGGFKPFRTVGFLIGLVQSLIRTVLLLGGGWVLYSKLFISHNLSLPAALGGERKTFNSGGIPLSYYTSGSGDRPVVLLHSINAAASAYEMKPLYEALAGSRRVYALELPGFGFSGRLNIEYSPALYIDAIKDFLRTQVDGPADVVALSLSSEFAARAASEAPELFSSLTLISPTGFSERASTMGASGGRMDAFFRLLRWPVVKQAFYDLLTTYPVMRYFLQKSFDGPIDENLLAYGYLSAHQPGAYYAPFAFVRGDLFSRDMLEVYDALNLPVLVLYDKDPYSSFDYLEEYGERPNWTLRRVKDTRGLPQFEKPDVTAGIVEDYLADYALPASV